jgi:serine/threonine protein kinase
LCIDLTKKALGQGGSGFVFVAEDGDDKIEIALKLIPLGPKGSEEREMNQKEIEKEMKIGMIVAKESPFLVSYSEIFEWGDYFCIKMEYCQLGDLQTQIDKKRIFTELVKILIKHLYFSVRK